MKFEGHQVNIPIKGIMRAGTDNVCADGAMQEVIGMEYKDGSWLPYKEEEEDWDVVLASAPSTSIVNIKSVYLHKTSDGEEHYVFVVGALSNLLYEVGIRDTENKKIYVSAVIATKVKDVSFDGNMLCIATVNGMEYFIWQDGDYHAYQVGYYPQVELKVASGWNTLVEENKKVGIRYVQKIKGTYASTGAQALIDEELNRQTILGGLAAASGEVRDRGGLTGYFLACVAYRNKNGNIIGASAPILLAPPSVSFGRNEENLWIDVASGQVNNRQFRKNSTDYTELLRENNTSYAIFPDLKDADKDYGFGNDSTSATKEGFKDVFFDNGLSAAYTDDGDETQTELGSKRQLCAIMSEGTGWETYKSVNRPYPSPLSCARQRIQYSSSSGYICSYIYYSIASFNKLLYRIPSLPSVPSGVVNDVQSVCIFISPEISPYSINKAKEGDFDSHVYTPEEIAAKQYFTNQLTSIATYYPKEKSTNKIIDELRNLSGMYLIKEIPIDEITASNNWISIDLEGKLGDNLVVREQLPITAFDLRTIFPEQLESYNMRLHEIDYKTEFFKGYSYPQFTHNGGERQYESDTLNPQRSWGWYIYVIIEDNEGNSKVVNVAEGLGELPAYLTPILSYPDIRAKSMTVAVYNTYIGNVYTYERTFQLKAYPSLGIAAYIANDLHPIGLGALTPTTVPESEWTPPTADNILRYYHNAMRASDAAYPTYFPAAQTYTFGNEKIVGVARMTMPMSQDMFGAYPMIVFCTDGIYSLGVDRTGNGAYTNIAFVSPEVCVNKNSICELGGAVLFATDKGLMILTSNNNVEMFTPHLNGKPRFLPAASESEEAHGVYKKMIDNTSILSTSTDPFADSISTTDFIDFIKDAGTHLIYISIKNKLLAYNKAYDYSYFIDIQTVNATKLSIQAACDDGNHVDRTIWRPRETFEPTNKVYTFSYEGETDNEISCLILSRPIKIQQDDKCSYRVVLTGYFEGLADNWAELLVLGSLDGDNWRVTGHKGKKLEGGFHNFGAITERDSWKYLMFIFAGKLSDNSHIDGIDITVDGRYNNKKR